MNEEKNNQLLNEKLKELNAIKNRMDGYDWEYRLKRFDEKIQYESSEVANQFKKIK